MKNLSIASINDPVDGVSEVYFLGSTLKPGRSSMGWCRYSPSPNLQVCMCAHTYKRKGAFLPIFGADGLKTFVQSLL